MKQKVRFFASAAISSFLLASCGGDDSTPTPTPTETPTPSPTPTATPTPTSVDFGFAEDFTAGAVNTAYVFAYFTPDGGSEVWSDGSRRNGFSRITYKASPESAVYEWPDTLELTGFGASDLVTDTPTLRAYRKGQNALTLELPFEHVLRASYESVAPYTRNTVAGSLRSLRKAIFLNTVTTTDPISADLTYTGTAQVAGGVPGTTPSGAITSAATTLTVQASDKKISGTIRIYETVAGTPVQRAALPISATVGTNNMIAGDINDAANGFKGKFIGALAGPTRQEVFLIFNVAHTDKREFIGSFIGG